MSEEGSSVQSSAPSTPSTLSSDSEDQQRPLNPRLCEQCQAWDDVSTIKLYLLQARSLACWEESSRDTACLICRAIVDVVNTRFDRVPQPGSEHAEQAWLFEAAPSELSITVDEYLFWDVPLRYQTLEQMLDHNDGKVRMMMKLHIAHGCPRPPSPGGDGSPVQEHSGFHLTATPRFCLRYTSDSPPALESIERWEFPFFHAPLLRAWVEGCEDLHRGHCNDTHGIG